MEATVYTHTLIHVAAHQCVCVYCCLHSLAVFSPPLQDLVRYVRRLCLCLFLFHCLSVSVCACVLLPQFHSSPFSVSAGICRVCLCLCLCEYVCTFIVVHQAHTNAYTHTHLLPCAHTHMHPHTITALSGGHYLLWVEVIMGWLRFVGSLNL